VKYILSTSYWPIRYDNESQEAADESAEQATALMREAANRQLNNNAAELLQLQQELGVLP
jgi:hypothetical protein